MPENNTWKQPIPVDVFQTFGKDKACLWLYIALLLRAANDHQVVNLGKKIVVLERGDVLFGRRSFAEFMLMSSSGIEKSLHRLEKIHQKVTSKVTPNGTIVSIVGYDNVVSMNMYQWPAKEPVSNQRETSEEPVRNLHKSVRVKERKSVRSIYTLNWVKEHEAECLEKLTELYPDKEAKVAYDEFVQQNTAKDYHYKDYFAALKNWCKEDRFGHYKKGGHINARGGYVDDSKQYGY